LWYKETKRIGGNQMNPSLDTRARWLKTMISICSPVLFALSKDQLREQMPVESISPKEDREQYTYLEAFGRIVTGMAPWIGSTGSSPEEEMLRKEYAELIRKGISISVDPDKKDRMNYSVGYQPIVDAAFLAQGILRAPHELWDPLDDQTKARLLDAMRSTKTRKPYQSNWLLFSAIIECLLHHAGTSDWDPMRIDLALLKHEEWYKGDGWYGDGKNFHWDYYNSFVIQPMLIDILNEIGNEDPRWEAMKLPVLARASHYATHLEHLISPEGSYPLIGRSLAYRFGAFQALSQAALMHNLEDGLHPAQVRCAMTAVMDRIMAFPDVLDDNGWLAVGICGHQSAMGEPYISTGSLYLCSVFFLALGLPATDPFWADPDEPWTMKQLWAGQNRSCEHAI